MKNEQSYLRGIFVSSICAVSVAVLKMQQAQVSSVGTLYFCVTWGLIALAIIQNIEKLKLLLDEYQDVIDSSSLKSIKSGAIMIVAINLVFVAILLRI